LRIEKKHLHHGAALTQLVEDPRFTSLNKATSAYGHYVINKTSRLFVKYSTKSAQPWRFAFSEDEIARIKTDTALDGKVFVAFVCGQDGVCAFPANDLWSLVDVDAGTQSVTVERPLGKSMQVKGAAGKLTGKIAVTSFPDLVLA
jgi:hypothetical protein